MKMVKTISLMAILLMLGSCDFPLFGASKEIFGTVVIVENTERLQEIFSEDEGESLMRCIGTYSKLETESKKGK